MKKRQPRRAELIHALQELEARQLLSYSISSNSTVIMNTSLGEVAIALDANTPLTNTNFLSYVAAGSYTNTVFHRISISGQTQLNGSTESYSVVQGGGFTNNSGSFAGITTMGGVGALSAGTTYSTLALSGPLTYIDPTTGTALAAGTLLVPAGTALTITNPNDGNTQSIVVSSNALIGDSTLNVDSFTTTDAFPGGSPIQGISTQNTTGSAATIAALEGIQNEAGTSGNSNTVGTIAMARTSGTNSATSQFFFNVTDNSSYFDPNAGTGSPGYAVFGKVIRGLGIVDTIDNLSPETVGNFSNVPETSSGAFVTINTVTQEDTMTVTIGPHDAAGDHTVTFHDPVTGASSNISLNGADATLTFTGTGLTAKRGNGNLVVTGTNLELQEIASTDTTAKTNLVFSNPGRNKHINLGDVNITGSLNSISGAGVNLTGDLAVTGSVKKIDLLASNAAGFISIDTDSVANAPETFIDIPFLSDISIQSGGGIKELITRSYTVNDGTNRGLSANGNIEKVLVYGTMEASIDSNANIGKVLAGQTAGNIEASGTIGTIQLSQMQGGVIFAGQAYNAKTLDIKSIKVLGVLDNTRILSPGNIGPIKAVSMGASAVAAGIDSTGSDSPADGFTYALAANAYIKSINLKTPKSVKSDSFGDSEIEAYQVDSLHLGRVDTKLGSTFSVMGIQAVNLKSLVATTDQKQALDLSNITSQTALNALIAKRGLKLNSTATIGTLIGASSTAPGLTAGAAYTTIALNSPLTAAISKGNAITISSGNSSQVVTLASAASAGGTSLTVNSFTANSNYPAGSTINGTGFTIDIIPTSDLSVSTPTTGG